VVKVHYKAKKKEFKIVNALLQISYIQKEEKETTKEHWSSFY